MNYETAKDNRRVVVKDKRQIHDGIAVQWDGY